MISTAGANGTPGPGSRLTTAASRRLARALTTTLPRRLLLRSLRSWLRRAPGFRPATSLAHHVAASLADHDRFAGAELLSGSRIHLDLREHRHRYILLRGIWEEGTTRLLERHASPGWCFADVGADAGYYSLLARDLGGPDARVLCFEPIPSSSSLIRQSIEENRHGPSIEVIEAACGAEAGKATLRLSREVGNSGRATLFVDSASERGDEIEVSVVTLDQECAARGFRPDVVKIDVEGYEIRVLKGMHRLLADAAPSLIVCEVACDGCRPDPAGVVEMLGGHGYVPHRIAPSGDLEQIRLERVGEENLAFLRRA